ncbi:cytochrome P450 [Suillus paluster]|uniref:cytochrome P450 n=1 Tax=Suillus paluster TaxID=48578 RepID=UPI001B8688C0|nr:cytochrome P450 [Suillus paluster]KAG1750413.1 cytochrome P450 [Suillus paluster]
MTAGCALQRLLLVVGCCVIFTPGTSDHAIQGSYDWHAAFLALLSSAMLHPPNLSIPDNMQLVLSAAACLGIIIIARVYLPRSKSRLPLPPSPPKAWGFHGHVLPLRSEFLTIADWIDEYGPLITIRSRLDNIVIIGRYKVSSSTPSCNLGSTFCCRPAVDIMENQGKALADRPRMVAAGEIYGGGITITFTHFGERFRRMRRALHTHLQPRAAEAYEPLQMSHVKNTVLEILDDPDNFQNHVTRMLVKIMRPGAYLVDTIPWLKYLPWYGRDLKLGFERTTKHNMRRMNCVKKQMQSNVDIGPSFTKYMLESSDLLGLTEAEVASLASAFFAGGSSTTAVAICTVLMAAACFPEEQAIVQAELDAVIGRQRAPTFADQNSLPRLHAFISEAVRWRPIAANGLAHRTTTDVIWENYCIPAGTTVLGNHWAISRDPEVYPEPYAFKPQRWIDDQGHLRDDLKFFHYGFGRRVCPGQHVANSSALILWAFRLALDPTKPLDDMAYMNREMSKRPCSLEFETRIPETELRRMMQNDPEVV